MSDKPAKQVKDLVCKNQTVRRNRGEKETWATDLSWLTQGDV
jgi:hypothetical protein